MFKLLQRMFAFNFLSLGFAADGAGSGDEENETAKEIAKSLKGTIETAIDEGTKEFKDTVSALQKDIAEVKTNLKAKDEDGAEGRKKVGEFFRTYVKCIKAGDFSAMKTMNEGTDADGGYAVPVEFHKELVRVAEISGVARRLANIIPMGTDTKDITNLESGATAFVVGEQAAITASTPQFGRKVLNARKFAVLVKSTMELIDDNMLSEDITTLVAKLAGEALAELEDDQMINGDGTGLNQTGILVDANVNVVTMDAGNTSFADITYQDLVKVKGGTKLKFKRASRGKNAWLMSEDVFNNIESIVDTTGQPIIKERANLPDNYTLMGYPIEITEKMPGTPDDAVDTKFLVFGSFRYYAMGDRKSVTSETGYASGDFEKDIKSMKVIERVAGVITIPTAFTVLKTAAA